MPLRVSSFHLVFFYPARAAVRVLDKHLQYNCNRLTARERPRSGDTMPARTAA